MAFSLSFWDLFQHEQFSSSITNKVGQLTYVYEQISVFHEARDRIVFI